ITPADGQTLRPYEVAQFSVKLPGAIPGTVRLAVLSYNELGGTIGWSQEKSKRAELRQCMKFSVLLPNPVAKGSESVEIRLKNTCDKPIRSERTAFRLVFKDNLGLVKDQRVDRFHEDAEAGKEIRRSLILPVAPLVHPEIAPYDELLDR